ncbi:MAG TPA: sigma-70 family RNA polymerase sigma factor [Armatimonadaceae bacterium]|nr:sigma-70 family RNA polymerase sigma factor [Armatimonadaceae bacterium]
MFFRRSSGGGEAAAADGVRPLPQNTEERRLVDRSRRGDLEAFDQLVRLYEKNVYSTAYRLSGSYDDASDIAQEAFVRAWNNLKSFRGDSAFSTWLYRIVTNVFLDDRKRKRARPHRSLEEVMTLEESTVTRQFEDPTPGPQDVAEGDERRKILEMAIKTLPEEQRVMVVLYHTQGLSYEEIAEITKCPMGTVKSRLNRARLALRDRLSPAAELFGVTDGPM